MVLVKMEVREILRKLITHEHMPQYDYQNSWIAFKTVWHTDAFSYCLCNCGIDHEYVEYVISGTREIRENVFEKVVDCITKGECQHVANAPKEYVRETRVHALHIIAAVPGFSKELDIEIDQIVAGGKMFGFYSKLLRLTPYDMVILKDNLGSIESKKIRFNNWLVMSERENEKVHFRQVSFDVLCVERNNLQILANILDNRRFGHVSIELALEAAMNNKNTQIVELIVDKREWFMKAPTSEDCRNNCCKLAIKYDKPKYLHKLLKHLSDEPYDGFKVSIPCLKTPYPTWPRKFEIEHTLADCTAYANALERWECKDVITEFKNGFADVSQTDISEKAKKDILRRYPYGTKIASFADVNDTFMDGTFPSLDDFPIDKFAYLSNAVVRFRSRLEVYIYLNPDVKLLKPAVERGIQADERLNQMPDSDALILNTYIIDGKQHGACGHDDFALNMTVPLLMECGFPASDNALKMVESRKSYLPLEEYNYIQHYVCNARSLKVLSRDTLRRHFVGQMIHKFVNNFAMPVSIKDYILLKPQLRCLPEDLSLYSC